MQSYEAKNHSLQVVESSLTALLIWVTLFLSNKTLKICCSEYVEGMLYLNFFSPFIGFHAVFIRLRMHEVAYFRAWFSPLSYLLLSSIFQRLKNQLKNELKRSQELDEIEASILREMTLRGSDANDTFCSESAVTTSALLSTWDGDWELVH